MVLQNSRKPGDECLDSRADEGWWASVLQDEATINPCEGQSIAPLESKDFQNVLDWDWVMQVFQRDEIIILRVIGFNRGGLLVQGNRIHGFVPVSHLVGGPESLENDEKRRKYLSRYLGKSLKLKVIECEPKEERIVFSERAAKAGEGVRRQLLLNLKPGDKADGSVTNITDFGVFVDLGGVEGLIHVSELSWGRVQHPSDILRVGDKIEALVLSVSEENSRVALSLKQLSENPWQILGKTISPGDVIQARVSAIMRYGFFVRLDQGVEGLIHITSVRLPPGTKDLKRFIRIGQNVHARVLHLDVDKRRLGLSLESVE